ncbi:MAG TPA: universal stress protein [Polyangia bacterium]|jgi:nucleotide-binding universal stress UspA family protein|nr:universal stress protein [Polyangia bacterium]
MSKLKNILVGLEASEGTVRATELALALGKEDGASLVGLAIIEAPSITAGAAMGIGASSYKHERDEALLLDAKQQAREFEQRFSSAAKAAGVDARTVEITGKAADALLSELEHHDLGVLGRYANFRFETEAQDLGTWDTILHKATKPIIVVPEAPLPKGRDVILAYDGSSAAKRAMRFFVDCGLHRDRTVHVVTVNDSGELGWELATSAAEELGHMGVAAQVRNVVSALPVAEALIEVAAQVNAGLIVMGSFAHSRLRSFFRGSVTQQLVEKTTIPLFLTH